MARTATVFEVLIASPSDVSEERRTVRDALYEWNVAHGRNRGCVLEPVMWETHSTPEMGDRPQAIINRQLVENCDALIGTFWTRIGSPTGEAPSGTIEEINRIAAEGKPVMLYFSSRPVDPGVLDVGQLTAVREFRSSCRKSGLCEEYGNPEELARKLALGITRLADRLLTKSEVPVRAGKPSPPSAEVRKMLKQWQLNTSLRAQGHDPCKQIMRSFVAWYVANEESLSSPAWQALADLANQLTRYRFVMGPESSEKFFEIGEAVLTNAVEVLKSGAALPVSAQAVKVLRAIHGADGERETAEKIGVAIGATEDEVRQTILELEQQKLVKSQMYFNAPADYGLSGAGLVSLAVHSSDGSNPAEST